MRLAKFKSREGTHFGIVEDNSIKTIEGSIFDTKLILTNKNYNLNEVKLLPPSSPTKIIAVGLNYKDHAKELKMKLPEEPLIFMKPSSSIIGPFDEIIYPQGIKRLDYEAELGIVIKKLAKDIPIDEAKDYILGYTCLNDVTARDLQRKDVQWTRAKSFDTFCPTGPFIVTDIETENLDIKLYLNKKIMQSSNTKNLIFSPDYLVSFISKICTLLPGDIIATGTPSGVGPMRIGDEVEIKIQNVGTLKNRVIKDEKSQ